MKRPATGSTLLAAAVAAALVVGAVSFNVAIAVFTDTASVPGNTSSTDTLNPPTGLTATGGASVTLNWTATVDAYASGHRVLRGTASGGPYTQIAQVTPRTTTTYTDTPGGTGTFYYVLRAFYQNWESANSSQASATKTGGTKSIQTGTVSMTAATRTATIATVDPAKSFVLCYFRTNSSNASDAPTCTLTNSTTVTVQTGAANSSEIVQWYVVEFATGMTVQRGSTNFTTTDTTINVSTTAVDTAKTFVLVNSRTASTAQNIDEQGTIRARLTSSTNLELSRNEAGIAVDAVWQVIQIDSASVQSGVTTITSTNTSATATIAPVDTAKSFLLLNVRANALTNGNEDQYYVRGTITNSTTVTFNRKVGTNSVDVSWFAVEMIDASTVQKGTVSAATTETQLNATLSPAVDTSLTVPFISSSVTGSGTADQDSGSYTPTFTATTNLQVQRGSAQSRPSDVDWFVVQFAP